MISLPARPEGITFSMKLLNPVQFYHRGAFEDRFGLFGVFPSGRSACWAYNFMAAASEIKSYEISGCCRAKAGAIYKSWCNSLSRRK